MTEIPTFTIETQAHTTTPVNSDDTIMDDTVMTMDGSGLMGGPVTIQPIMKSDILPPDPSPKIKIGR